MDIRFKSIFLLICIALAITSCSNKPDCMIADSLKELKSEALEKKGLYMYLRSSGFSEKEHFYELYKQPPTFDECGVPTTDALYQAHVDRSLGTPKKLIVKNNQIKIEYKAGEGAWDEIIIVLE